MSFFFNDIFRNHSADWVDISLAVINFAQFKRPLKVNIQLFQSQGWNQYPKEILSTKATLRRQITRVRLESLPIGIPIYLHISGDCELADADEDGLITGIEQFLGNQAQIRLFVDENKMNAKLETELEAKRKAKELRRRELTEKIQRQRDLWSTGPRRFKKMYSIASRQSLSQLSQCETELASIEAQTNRLLSQLNEKINGQTLGGDLATLQSEIYDLDDKLEDLFGSRLQIVDLQRLQSGATAASQKKQQLIEKAQKLAKVLRGALTHEIFRKVADYEDSDSDSDSDSEDQAPSLSESTFSNAMSTDAEDTSPKKTRAAEISSVANPKTTTIPVNTNTENHEKDPPPRATIINKTKKYPPVKTENDSSCDGISTSAKPLSKKYSILSEQRLVKLEDIRHRVDVITSEYDGLMKILEDLDVNSKEGKEAVFKIKNECAQLFGTLEKLQFKEIDAVLVGDLTTGQADARAARKKLTHDVNALSEKIRGTVNEIKITVQ